MAEPLTTPGALGALRAAERVTLICHASPDSDCVGGLMALTHVLRGMGKTANPFSPDPIPDYLLHVPGSDEVPGAPSTLPDADLIVTIEAASLDRTEPIRSNARATIETVPILNVDHHASNTGYGAERIFDPRAASVCEVLYRVIRDLGRPIDRTVAYCLLTGIVGDTRSFRTSSTTPETLRIAGELIAAGAPLNRVSDAVSKHRRPAELAIWADVLGRARCEDGILWTSITRADSERHGVPLEQIDGIVEFLSDTRDISTSVVFKDVSPGKVRVSMRSDGTIDLTEVAARWGGGGHRQASGCTVTGATIQEAEVAVIAEIKRALAKAPPADGARDGGGD